MVKGHRNYAYTWRHGWRWIWEDIRFRSPACALRTFYWSILRGWDGETCQVCGRPYLFWRADDDLYVAVIGNHTGLYCLAHFDARAEARGIQIRWKPERWSPNG